MTKSLYGFSPAEVDAADTVTAVVAQSHEPQSKKINPLTDYLIGTYAVLFAGQGKESAIWGGGPIVGQNWPMMANGVLRLLSIIPPNKTIILYAHEQLWHYVSEGGWAIQGAKDRPGYEIFRRLHADLAERRWIKGRIAHRAKLEKRAKALAKQVAYQAANRYRDENYPSFSNTSTNATIAYTSPPPFTVTVEGP